MLSAAKESNSERETDGFENVQESIKLRSLAAQESRVGEVGTLHCSIIMMIRSHPHGQRHSVCNFPYLGQFSSSHRSAFLRRVIKLSQIMKRIMIFPSLVFTILHTSVWCALRVKNWNSFFFGGKQPHGASEMISLAQLTAAATTADLHGAPLRQSFVI